MWWPLRLVFNGSPGRWHFCPESQGLPAYGSDAQHEVTGSFHVHLTLGHIQTLCCKLIHGAPEGVLGSRPRQESRRQGEVSPMSLWSPGGHKSHVYALLLCLKRATALCPKNNICTLIENTPLLELPGWLGRLRV